MSVYSSRCLPMSIGNFLKITIWHFSNSFGYTNRTPTNISEYCKGTSPSQIHPCNVIVTPLILARWLLLTQHLPALGRLPLGITVHPALPSVLKYLLHERDNSTVNRSKIYVLDNFCLIMKNLWALLKPRLLHCQNTYCFAPGLGLWGFWILLKVLEPTCTHIYISHTAWQNTSCRQAGKLVQRSLHHMVHMRMPTLPPGPKLSGVFLAPWSLSVSL